MPPPLITLEEHYYSDAVYAALDDATKATLAAQPALLAQLRELSDPRLRAMDAGGVGLQVVSHGWIPGGGAAAAVSRAGNDEVAARIARNGGGGEGGGGGKRWAAFATLPMGEPAAAAAELRRCVAALGFVGALVDNHAHGGYYDGAAYDAVWAAAQELDVPIYLHPTWPTPAVAELLYAGDFPPAAAASLGTVAWGWHSDVAVHVLRLFAAGVFDRFPRLKLILGHMGEMLPFMLERCSDFSGRFGAWGAHTRPLPQVWAENIWITTAGVWSVAPLHCVLQNTRVERVLYSVDYPFQTHERGLAWWAELERSGLLDREGLEKVAYKNAEALLKVKIPAGFVPVESGS